LKCVFLFHAFLSKYQLRMEVSNLNTQTFPLGRFNSARWSTPKALAPSDSKTDNSALGSKHFRPGATILTNDRISAVAPELSAEPGLHRTWSNNVSRLNHLKQNATTETLTHSR